MRAADRPASCASLGITSALPRFWPFSYLPSAIRRRRGRTGMFTNLFRSRDWFFLGPLGLGAIVLGYWGFLECDPSRPCHVVSGADAFFRAIGLLRLSSNYVLGSDPWQLVIAQFALPLMALLGGAKLLMVNVRRDLRVALAHRARNHIIVCGL